MRKKCIKEGREYKVEKINIENSKNKISNISYDYQLLNDEQQANIIKNENYLVIVENQQQNKDRKKKEDLVHETEELTELIEKELEELETYNDD